MSLAVPDVSAPANTLRVIIVDDEPLARDCMRLALEQMGGVSIVAECRDGIVAAEAIGAQAPDLVLLDVQMPGLDDFGVIERIGAACMPPVVFVTAYDAHALRAFEVHALDYVLKPFDDRRLVAAVEVARSRIRERKQDELGRRLTEVLREWQGTQAAEDDAASAAGGASGTRGASPGEQRLERANYVARFTVREDGRARFVPVAAIDWIEADGNYLVLHAGEAQHRVRAPLRDVMRELDPARFVRIHRSTIVNVERIREVQPWFGGDYIAILKSGQQLRVSRGRAAQLLRPMV